MQQPGKRSVAEQSSGRDTSSGSQAPQAAEAPEAGRGILQRMLRNTGKVLSGKGVGGVLDLAFLALAARALGPAEFGVMTLIVSYVQLVRGLAKFQSWQAVVRYGAHSLETGRIDGFHRLIAVTVLVDLVTAVAAAMLAGVLVPLVGPTLGWPPEVFAPAVWFCAVIVFTMKSTPNGLLRLFGRFDLLGAFGALVPGARCLLGAVALLANAGLSGFLVAYGVATAVGAVFVVAVAIRELRRRALFPRRMPRLRGVTADHPGLTGFLLYANANASLQLLPRHLAPLLVGALLGPTPAGLFRIAQTCGDALSVPAKMLGRSVYPDLSRLVAAGAVAGIRALLLRAGAVAAGTAAAVWLLLTATGEWLLGVAMGPSYLSAYPALVLLGLASVLPSVAFPAEPMLFALGRPGTVSWVRAVEVTLYLCALAGLAPIGGLTAAAAAAPIAAAVGTVGLAWSALHALNRVA